MPFTIAACRSAVFAAAYIAAAGAGPAGTESAWLYGGISSYAYYFADILVGQPTPQRASVIVDTGSRLVAFPCSGCEHCGRHLNPAFDISRSETARWVNCSSGCADTCSEGHCAYSETYSEGSSISGFWFDDSVALGDPAEQNAGVRARLGCHQNENRLFFTQRANGIMGLAPSELGGQPTLLQDLFKDKAHVNAQVFSLCLAEHGGLLTVGGYDSSYHAGNGETEGEANTVQWTRLSVSRYYFLFPEALDMGGEPLPLSAADFGETIMDSGTTYTYLPRPAYQAFINHLRSYCAARSGCGATLVDDECYRVSEPSRGPSDFPTLTWSFEGGTKVAWPPTRYLQSRGSWGTWCRTVLENSDFQTVLGLSFMVHKDVIFDIDNLRIGLAEASCPEHVHQQPMPEQAWARVGVAKPFPTDVVRPLSRPLLLSIPVFLGLSATLVLWAARRARKAVRSPPSEVEVHPLLPTDPPL